jgi:hypothetical protein
MTAESPLRSDLDTPEIDDNGNTMELKWKYEPETGRTVFRLGKKMFYCDPGEAEPSPVTITIAKMWFRLHDRSS